MKLRQQPIPSAADDLAKAPPPRAPSVFWFALWLGVLLAGCKLATWTLVGGGAGHGFWRILEDVLAVTHEDLLFAVVIGLLACAAVTLLRRRPAACRRVWLGCIGLYALCAIYAVASIAVFIAIRTPLTYPLLHQASGELAGARASVSSYASAGILTALAAVPAAYLLVAWACHRRLAPVRRRLLRLAGLAALLVYCYAGRQIAWGSWSWQDNGYLARSPHYALLSSCLGDRGVVLDEHFPADYLDEFATAAKRPLAPMVPLDPARRPKNVILLVLESVSTQHLGLYGSPFDTTPCLQKEAAHALVFDNFYAHGVWTNAALYSLSMSSYSNLSWRHVVMATPRIAGDTLAPTLHAQGYDTAFFTPFALTQQQQQFLARRGYDQVCDAIGLDPAGDGSPRGTEDGRLVQEILQAAGRSASPGAGAGKPFFIMSWTRQAHHPYVRDPRQALVQYPGVGDANLNGYLNCLHEEDRQIGLLLDGLRQRGLADDTLVVITGDHGEAFGHPHNAWSHGTRLYEECVHVPLMIWNPRLYPSAARSATVGGQIDVNPTILDLLGIAPPPGTWQGRSLFDPTRPPRVYMFAANADYRLAIREGNWKLIHNQTEGTEELYDLSADPTEQHNLAPNNPDRCSALRQHLSAWVSFELRHFRELLGGD